jgi:hypothetical protein
LLDTNTLDLVSVFSVIMTLNDSNFCLNGFVVTGLDDSCRRSFLFEGSVLLADTEKTWLLLYISDGCSSYCLQDCLPEGIL